MSRVAHPAHASCDGRPDYLRLIADAFPVVASGAGRYAASVIMAATAPLSYLDLALAALERQSLPTDRWEVLVAPGARADGAGNLVRDFATRGRLDVRLVAASDSDAGRPALLNAVVRSARGRVLIFLDADRLAAPDLVACHLAHHVRGEAVVAGPGNARVLTHLFPPEEPALAEYPPLPMFARDDVASDAAWLGLVLPAGPDDGALFRWAQRTGRSLPGAWRLFSSANGSVSRAAFNSVGGFDVRIADAPSADADLARRLSAIGLPIVWADGALAVRQVRPPSMPSSE